MSDQLGDARRIYSVSCRIACHKVSHFVTWRRAESKEENEGMPKLPVTELIEQLGRITGSCSNPSSSS